MKRRIIALLTATVCLTAIMQFGGLTVARAEAVMGAEEAMTAFCGFSENAAGRYVSLDGDEMEVVELIPAFGRLFAAVGQYMEGDLYSFYAAELTPNDLSRPESRAGNSETSFVLNEHLYSVMSNAGLFWPETPKRRFTLTGEGLALSGGGEEDALFLRDDEAPSTLCYGREDLEMIYGVSGSAETPAELAGAWSATWRAEGVDWIARVELGAEGVMTALLTPFDSETEGRPPQLYRGGYILTPEEDGFALRYMLSATSTGTMPYAGGARLALDGDELTVTALESAMGWAEECLLLPETGADEAAVVYERGGNPMRRGFLTLADERDGQKFFDVTARELFGGEETLYTVMKDGSTVFGWSSARDTLNMVGLWTRIKTGKPIPALYHTNPWGMIDILLILNDISENTELLMARAPYFSALRDYRENVYDRQGSRASVYFDGAGEPTLHLENRTDYEVQRDFTARVVRRVGSVFTAESEEGDRVVFEIQPYGWLEIIEQRLSFATHGFPGFGEHFYQDYSETE